MIDIVLAHEKLGQVGRPLGAGGQGRIFALPNLTLPDAPGRLVYKES